MTRDDEPLRVGDVLYGFCGGAFGRDSYADKRVEAIGADWVVVREDNGAVGFACDDTRDPRSTRASTPVELAKYRTEETT